MDNQLTKAEKAEEERWQAEGDLRTLRQAREIRADKSRMKRARTLAEKQLADIKSANT